MMKRKRFRKGLYKVQGGLCALCGGQMTLTSRLNPLFATLDHIVPRADGGSEEIENMRLAHRGCNSTRDRHNILPLPIVGVIGAEP